MKSTYRIVVAVLLFASLALAQAGMGVQPNETQFKEVSVDTLNIHYDIPVVDRNGIGLPVHFGLHFNNNFYTNIGSGLNSSSAGNTSRFGWYDGPVLGLAYGKHNTGICDGQSSGTTWYSFTDHSGNAHAIIANVGGSGGLDVCTSTYLSAYIYDGSGITFYANVSSAYIVFKDGAKEYFNTVPYNVVDSNGNTVRANGSFFSQALTDTLGNQYTISGGGTAASPAIYTYKLADGVTAASVQINYTTQTVQTNFVSCPNHPAASTDLVSSILLADGTSYAFTYEPTPGFSGYVTGRLASVTLPTGGTITYTYPTPQTINCTTGGDLGPAQLTRATSDGTITFVRNTSTWKQTTVTLPANAGSTPSGNQIVYTFAPDAYSSGQYFEVERKTYAGAAQPGTLVADEVTCYNGNQTNCAAVGSISIPTSQRDVYTTLSPMATAARHTEKYDSFHNVIYTADYDFGASTPTIYTNYWYGTTAGAGSCVAIGNGINDRLCTYATYDGSNTLIANGGYTYDSHGNQLSTSVWANGPSSGGTFLNMSRTFNPNGTTATSTDAAGKVTTYAYNGTGGCSNGFMTSATNPLNQTGSKQWNCVGAVSISSTDANGNTASTDYSINGLDPLFRAKASIDELNFERTYSYASKSTTDTFTFGSSTVSHTAAVDTYGRPLSKQVLSGSGQYSTQSNTYYGFNGTGLRTGMSSVACIATSIGATCPSSPVTTQTTDVFGRQLVTTSAVSGTMTYAYPGRDVVATLAPAPSGESVKKAQLEIDGLGLVKSICLISSASGSGACGQDNGGTGFLTTFTYDPFGHVLTVTHNAQSATKQTTTFTYDRIGRKLSEAHPESGTKTYVYDTDATCGTSNGDLVKTTDNAGNVTCYQYDNLHRITTVRFPSGPNAASSHESVFYWDRGYNQAPLNVIGRLGAAITCPNPNDCVGTPVTIEEFSYSARGEVKDVWETTPNSGGTYHTTAAFAANGTLTSIGGIPGQSNVTFGLDAYGRLVSALQGTTHYVTGVNFSAAGKPTKITFGTGDHDDYTYDSSTGRMSQFSFTVGATPKTFAGMLTWSSNGTLKQLAITDGFYAAGTQTCSYTYDDLSRLAGDACGSLWSQTFTYDPFNNITKSGNTSWLPGYDQTNNRYQNGSSYDSNGALTYDTYSTYRWDSLIKLISANAGTTAASCSTVGTCLVYDAFGQVVEKNVAGVYTQTIYSPIGKLAMMNGQTMSHMYIPLPGGATLHAVPSTVSVWHKDWLGTVRVSSEYSSRSVSIDRAFAPYGELYDSNAGETSSENFTGDLQDIFAGLFDTPARELDQRSARWLSPDPAHASSNGYAYSVDPLRTVDNSGLMDDVDPSADSGTGDDGSGANASGWGILVYTSDPGIDLALFTGSANSCTEAGGDSGTTNFDPNAGMSSAADTANIVDAPSRMDFNFDSTMDAAASLMSHSNEAFGVLAANQIESTKNFVDGIVYGEHPYATVGTAFTLGLTVGIGAPARENFQAVGITRPVYGGYLDNFVWNPEQHLMDPNESAEYVTSQYIRARTLTDAEGNNWDTQYPVSQGASHVTVSGGLNTGHGGDVNPAELELFMQGRTPNWLKYQLDKTK